jgi:hypothetical protein
MLFWLQWNFNRNSTATIVKEVRQLLTKKQKQNLLSFRGMRIYMEGSIDIADTLPGAWYYAGLITSFPY